MCSLLHYFLNNCQPQVGLSTAISVLCTTLVYKYLHWEFMFRLNQSRVLVYLVLDLPQREDGGNALLDNPEKGALMMNTTLVYKYLDWEFMFSLNQSRVLVYLVLDLP